MKSFRRERTMTAVFLILSMIFALALIIPWYRVYKFEHAAIAAREIYIWEGFIKHPKTGIIFAVLTITWFVLAWITSSKYKRVTDYYGGYVGAYVGRFILIAEYLGFAALLAVLMFVL